MAVGSSIGSSLDFFKAPGIDVVQKGVYRSTGASVFVSKVREILGENLLSHGIPVFHLPAFSIGEPPNDGSLLVGRIVRVGQYLVQDCGKVRNHDLRDRKRGFGSDLTGAVNLGRVQEFLCRFSLRQGRRGTQVLGIVGLCAVAGRRSFAAMGDGADMARILGIGFGLGFTLAQGVEGGWGWVEWNGVGGRLVSRPIHRNRLKRP